MVKLVKVVPGKLVKVVFQHKKKYRVPLPKDTTEYFQGNSSFLGTFQSYYRKEFLTIPNNWFTVDGSKADCSPPET